MTKHLVEIEDGVIPDGFEVVRVGVPAIGDSVLTPLGSTHVIGNATPATHIIVREKWTPGNITLKPGWVAMDKCGDWYWYSGQPYLADGDWLSGEFDMCSMIHVTWTPPPCTGPADSLRQIK